MAMYGNLSPNYFITAVKIENSAYIIGCCVMGMSSVKMGQTKIPKFVMCAQRKKDGP